MNTYPSLAYHLKYCLSLVVLGSTPSKNPISQPSKTDFQKIDPLSRTGNRCLFGRARTQIKSSVSHPFTKAMHSLVFLGLSTVDPQLRWIFRANKAASIRVEPYMPGTACKFGFGTGSPSRALASSNNLITTSMMQQHQQQYNLHMDEPDASFPWSSHSISVVIDVHLSQISIREYNLCRTECHQDWK